MTNTPQPLINIDLPPSLQIEDYRRKIFVVFVRGKKYTKAISSFDKTLLNTKCIQMSSSIIFKLMEETFNSDDDTDFYFGCMEEYSLICYARSMTSVRTDLKWFQNNSHRHKIILPFPRWRWVLENERSRIHCSKVSKLAEELGSVYMYSDSEYESILMSNQTEKSNYPISLSIARQSLTRIPDIFDSYILLVENSEDSSKYLNKICDNIKGKEVIIIDYSSKQVKTFAKKDLEERRAILEERE